MNPPSALSSLLTNTEYKNYIYNYLIYLLIYIPSNYSQLGTKNKMAHTKQTPKNPHVSRPTTAIGSDVQPE